MVTEVGKLKNYVATPIIIVKGDFSSTILIKIENTSSL
jgi:hypothetical protein